MIVLCAEEIQPDDMRIRPLKAVRCPLQDRADVPLPPHHLRGAMNAASRIIAEHRQGGRIYVACAAGINRSGLVMALTVREMLHLTGAEAVAWVRSRRDGALVNREFERVLSELPRPR